jgi:hypothetical protein
VSQSGIWDPIAANVRAVGLAVPKLMEVRVTEKMAWVVLIMTDAANIRFKRP